MPDKKNRKNDDKKLGRSPESSNDQLGENAGEGRLMKDREQKEKQGRKL